MQPVIARVLVDSPLPQLDHLFDYRVPPALIGEVRVGQRVSMPLRSTGRIAQGWVVELVDHSEFAGQLADLKAVLSPIPVMSPLVYALARRIADRAAGVASDVLRLAIPTRHVRAETQFLAEEIPSSEPIEPAALTGYAAATGAELTRPGTRSALTAIPRLLSAQPHDIPHWAATFAQIATHVLARGESIILAVPDYRDQRALERALSALVPADRIVAVDARQTAAARYRNHLRLISGGSFVVIGNRSAVLSPVDNASTIVMWDDSDSAFIEPHAPGVHSRDVALIRQEQTGAALIFAGFAHSVDVQRLVEIGWVAPCGPERPIRPRIILDGDEPRPGLSSAAFAAAKRAVSDGPVLLQVANPGYSTSGMCSGCRAPARCHECSGPLFIPNARRPAQCRVCGWIASTWQCSSCGGTTISPVGAAASRTAEQLGKAFPGVPVIVSDGEKKLTEVPADPALVIATRGAEPLANGGYRAVVLLDAARMLAREGLHVAEDAVRWWCTAASFAAADAPVYLPNVSGPLPTAFASWTLDSWATTELRERSALGLPPAVRTASVRGRRELVEQVHEIVQQLARDGRIEAFGPTPFDAESHQMVIRAEYALGARLATALKAWQIRVATEGRRGVPREKKRNPAIVRVRMDDPEVWE